MKTEDLFGLAIPVTYVVFLVVEALSQARGRGRAFPRVRWWRARGGLFLAVLMGINAVLPSLLPGALTRHHLLDLSGLGLLPGAALGYLAVSLANYAFHRAEHRVGFLWRHLHQLHHSPVRMDLSGAAYTHPLEVAVSVVIFVTVSTFILGLGPVTAALTGYIGAVFSMFQHLDVETPRALGYVIERPESHCVHHARDEHHHNYSDLPLWDMAFGTFRNPDTFAGEVGFAPEASRRVFAMLAGVDVQAPETTAALLHPGAGARA
jgi:sterol desaturase/sphingolipid hydroxylase (fatty acid hydroxylase superfamily)